MADVVLASLGVCVYLVLIPCGYLWVLLRYVPRVGRDSKWAQAYFGFLLLRTTYYLPFTTYYSLLTMIFYYLLLTTYYDLLLTTDY